MAIRPWLILKPEIGTFLCFSRHTVTDIYSTNKNQEVTMHREDEELRTKRDETHKKFSVWSTLNKFA